LPSRDEETSRRRYIVAGKPGQFVIEVLEIQTDPQRGGIFLEKRTRFVKVRSCMAVGDSQHYISLCVFIPDPSPPSFRERPKTSSFPSTFGRGAFLFSSGEMPVSLSLWERPRG
jgi:hypothetical protein